MKRHGVFMLWDGVRSQTLGIGIAWPWAASRRSTTTRFRWVIRRLACCSRLSFFGLSCFNSNRSALKWNCIEKLHLLLPSPVRIRNSSSRSSKIGSERVCQTPTVRPRTVKKNASRTQKPDMGYICTDGHKVTHDGLRWYCLFVV